MSPKKFLQLKQQVEKLQSEKDKAEGALDQLQKRLMNEFNCATLKEAKQLLAKLEVEIEDAEKTFEKRARVFNQEFGETLGTDT